MPFYMVPEEGVTVVIDGETLKAEPKKFKTGSVGWYLGGKIKVRDMRVQLSMSLVIVGSKPPGELIDVESVDQLTLDQLPGIDGPEMLSDGKPTKKPRKPKKPA